MRPAAAAAASAAAAAAYYHTRGEGLPRLLNCFPPSLHMHVTRSAIIAELYYHYNFKHHYSML